VRNEPNWGHVGHTRRSPAKPLCVPRVCVPMPRFHSKRRFPSAVDTGGASAAPPDASMDASSGEPAADATGAGVAGAAAAAAATGSGVVWAAPGHDWFGLDNDEYVSVEIPQLSTKGPHLPDCAVPQCDCHRCEVRVCGACVGVHACV
jgi:hypothetical protein